MLSTELNTQHTWLITGVAGFIGSNLLEYLIKHNQKVVGLDNFSNGFQENLDEVLSSCTPAQRDHFRFQEGDIRDLDTCKAIMDGVDIVLHQAALGSIPRSLEYPELTHDCNVNGMLNLLLAAKEHKVKAFVYASSSSVYGDSPILPKKEEHTGALLSPYAASKYIDEIYADVFARCFNLNLIGLRYFNVFGPRQNKNGPYAAVIPTWIDNILENKEIFVNGDGTTSRDFTYVANVVNMNILAAKKALSTPGHRVYNSGAEQQTTLLKLYDLISTAVTKNKTTAVKFRDFRPGDIKHSCADISLARAELNYAPICLIEEGIQLTVAWFEQKFSREQ